MSKMLYVERMLDRDMSLYPSGVIEISIPKTDVSPNPNDPSRGNRVEVRALLDGDIKFSLGNKWDNLINIGTDISDWQQTLNLGAYNLLNWVSASSVGWKGSDPLTITFSCYLVTYKRNQVEIMEQARWLAGLSAIYVNNSGNGVESNATVRVHGGYTPKFWVGNANLGDYTAFVGTDGVNTNTPINDFTVGDIYNNGVNNDTGMVKLHWGGPGGPVITGLLLDKCEVEISSVMCAPKEPLWIKLTPQFRTYRAMTVGDVDRIFRCVSDSKGKNQ